MKLRRILSSLAGIAVLVGIAAYIEDTRTTAQPSDHAAVKPKEVAQSSDRPGVQPKGAPQPSDTAVKPKEASQPSDLAAVQPKEAAQPSDATVKPKEASQPSDLAAVQPKEATQPSDLAAVKPREAAQPSDAAVKPKEAPQPSDTAVKPKEVPQPSDATVKSRESGTMRIAARSADPAIDNPPGNPLWVLPLKQLTITRERPIFSQSRRPPPAAPKAPPPPVAVRAPPKPAEPDHPAITLLGTIVGDAERIGVFLEPGTRNIVRMRIGEDHQGWVLRAIKTREVTLAKKDEQTVLELPPPGGEPPTMLANQFAPNMGAAPNGGQFVPNGGQFVPNAAPNVRAGAPRLPQQAQQPQQPRR